MTDVILTLNSGSSSIKFALFPADDPKADAVMRGKIAGIGRRPVFEAERGGKPVVFSNPLDQIAPYVNGNFGEDACPDPSCAVAPTDEPRGD